MLNERPGGRGGRFDPPPTVVGLNYFLLALFGDSFFFNKCRFCLLLSNSFTKSCYRMINWKNQFWISTINASLEKGFYLRYVTIFLFSILYNTFFSTFLENFVWGHTFMMLAKNDQFYEPLLATRPLARPFYSQKWPTDIFCLKH